eukprot:CAMPEP_0206300396 /NCGR_PEP_ID=MMETSP0106_2-20121207/7678_1 /ASSEMBLY_ACC=CAM_ASM_000206 /TAXON_ID=81532 /ORGANISM="Acanthoeca-like sp., Strain 10tr" /LENGTH=150 /DNA_ID=CAMNT_0053731115 /DNA_START=196 /DNA_END=647 /DNA_ORIENTATION=-
MSLSEAQKKSPATAVAKQPPGQLRFVVLDIDSIQEAASQENSTRDWHTQGVLRFFHPVLVLLLKNPNSKEYSVPEDVISCFVPIPHQVDQNEAAECNGEDLIHSVPLANVEYYLNIQGIAKVVVKGRDELCHTNEGLKRSSASPEKDQSR